MVWLPPSPTNAPSLHCSVSGAVSIAAPASSWALAWIFDVALEIARQVASGSRRIFGTMIESHLNAGAQKFTPGKDDPKALEYGKSITDACIGWPDSLELLDVLFQAVRDRRN